MTKLLLSICAVALAACHGGAEGGGDGGDGGGGGGDSGASIDAQSCAAEPADFFVATNGDDAWTGTLAAPNSAGTDGPFATLGHAQTMVRSLPRGGRTTPITVSIRGGTYFLAKTWTFDATDAGTAAVPTVYAAYPCETPVISGGFAIDSWTADASGALTATVPATASFAQLWVNDARRYRPRALAGGYGFIDTPTANGFHFTDAGAFSPSWHDLGDVEVVVFEKWTVSRKKVLGVNAATQTVTTDPFTNAGADHGYLQGHRYLVENVKEAIAPGQFYLDSVSHELSYMPLAGETAANVTAIAPALSQLVVANGLTYTTFRGLTFSHSNYVIPATGYQQTQGLWDIPAAVELDDSVHVTFDGCSFEHLGNVGVDIEGSGGFVASAGDPYSDEIINSAVTDIGVSGIRIGSDNRPPNTVTDATATQSVHVANNLIAGGGRYLTSGVGIIIGESHGNVIEHNEIDDLYQTGISVGFTFATTSANGTIATYPATLAHDNVLDHNLIHDIGRGVTDDFGGIYLLVGKSLGNVVSNNVIHDIVNSPSAGGYGGNGIYFDQGTSNVMATSNLVYRVTGSLMQQNYGRADVFTNNLFAFGKAGVYHHQFYEPAGTLWATFANNVVYYDTGPFFDQGFHCPAGSDCRSSFDLHDNDELSTRGAVTFQIQTPAESYTLAQFQAMQSEELGSISADPQLVDPTYGHDDFTLSATSPALGIGFVPFDPSTAGRTTTALMPPPAPTAFPLQEPADPATFY